MNDSAKTQPVTIMLRMPGMAAAVIEYVSQHFADEITLADLAAQVHMSRFNFCRQFLRCFGTTPMRWLWTFRTLLAAEFIATSPQWSLTDIAFACGFTSSAHFSRLFKQTTGQTPSQYRQRPKLNPKLPPLVAATTRAAAKAGGTASYDGVFGDQDALTRRVALRSLGGVIAKEREAV